MFDQITPLILTYNESPNIARTLDKLSWAKRVVVVDSGSTDETIKIVERYRQAETLHNPFTNFEAQWNFGLSHITSPWVLSLDADYELSDDFVEEVAMLDPSHDAAGYSAEFIYRVHGYPLRGSLYPPRVVLYRRDRARYYQEGHTQQLAITGEVLRLEGKIFHDDRKPLVRWVNSQVAYARDEAEYLLSRRSRKRADRIRSMGWPAPVLVLFYTLVVKRCALDGWPGWYYALQRLIAETLLALELADRRLRSNARLAAGYDGKVG